MKLDAIIVAVQAVNQAAHQSDDPRTRAILYAMKAALLTECLRRLSPHLVILHYQQLADRRVTVVVTLTGREGSRCWHLPWASLTKAAQNDVVRRIGRPSDHFGGDSATPQDRDRRGPDASTWFG